MTIRHYPPLNQLAGLALCFNALTACGGGSVGVDADQTVASTESKGAIAAPGPVAETAATAPDTTTAAALAPSIDTRAIPQPTAGYADERVRATTQTPPASDIGAFRVSCGVSHMAFDDPIVYPGQPGKSHLHVFFGNTGANANSTAASIAGSGNSTCDGGTVNRSAYWVPALIDTRSGAPVVPTTNGVYYKTGNNGIAPAAVKAFPPGLRMIAGDPKASAPGGPSRYKCESDYNLFHGPSLDGAERCPVGDTIIAEVFFPQCWDGINLDSPDHKSHMAYTSGGACPATHPVPTPEITFDVHYVVKEAGSTLRWRLSSDNYSGPAGYSSHGDWFNGWKPDVMSTWVTKCNNASVDCHAYLLGDGRMIY